MPTLARVSPWLIARFFCAIAHGDAKHRLWLLDEVEKFWGWKLDPELVAPGLSPQGEKTPETLPTGEIPTGGRI